jgi:hypothetical protein
METKMDIIKQSESSEPLTSMGYVCDINHSTSATTSQHKQKYYVCNAGSL